MQAQVYWGEGGQGATGDGTEDAEGNVADNDDESSTYDDDDLDNDNTWGAFFIVGITGDFAIDSLVREEAEKYQDMIILQVVEKYNAVTRNRHSNRTSFIKSYSVLPYKTHAFVQLSVSLSSISGFIMKTDDDCFVDIPKVLDLLHEQEERNGKQEKIEGE